MAREEVAVVDFETEKIENRPHFPPRPVGVAIKMPGKKGRYFSWGHPDGNNCSVSEARERLRDAYRYSTVFHNSGFDMDVSECYFGLRPVLFHDTVYQAFLNDPYERELKLKPLAAKHLGMPPEEQGDLRDWIQANVPGAKRSKTKWGEHISAAPAELVGRYAIGDVDRTYGLHRRLLPAIQTRGMGAAYQRELDVTDITMGMERSGVRVDVPRLRQALDVFERMDRAVVARIHRRLGVSNRGTISKEFNLNSGKQLGEALIRADKLSAVVRTAKGQVSTKIEVLKTTCNDKRLLQLLAVHSVCEKYITSFLRPWLAQAALTGDRILPTFNQVPNDGGGGARSGRYSSSNPNLQNVPADVEESGNKETLVLLQTWLREEFGYEFLGLRDYIVPDEGTVMICCDYSQQELRFLAHFEDDVLREAYVKDPTMDIHEFVRQLIYRSMGRLFERKHVKITVFGIVYGMGVAKLAARLGVDLQTARQIREAVYEAIPGIKRLMRELKYLEDHDLPLHTWGGREYYCEAPRVAWDEEQERWHTMTFGHKLLNYLIQPSAADCTKQGMINVREQVPQVRIAVQVHDELMVMAPHVKYANRVARAMCDIKMKVPMLSDPKVSTESWARVKKLKEVA